jgi:outer membrane protein assembly factor BamB
MIPWLLLTALAGPLGFRNDGGGVWADATMPGALTARWTTPTSSWGNSSVLAVGDLACATIEPTTLVCYDAATGAERWRAGNDYVETLTGDERAAWEAKLAGLPALESELEAKRKGLGKLRRDMRRADSEVTAADLEAASKALDALRSRYDAMLPYLTPPDKDVIGYTSPSPITDGTTIYALFGNGVLSAFSLDGTRRWSRWLGPAVAPMTGYQFGTTASPVLLDGDLLTTHGRLRRVDPTTGRDRWVDRVAWSHYGAPGIARAGGEAWLGTPDGRLLRASTGEQTHADFGEIWFTGPQGDGDVLYWVGGLGNGSAPSNAHAAAWKLVPGGGGVTPELQWRTQFPIPARVYMSPVIHGGLVYTVSAKTELVVFDAATGAVTHQVDLDPEMPGEAMQGVQVIGDQLVVADDRGGFGILGVGRTPGLRAVLTVGEESRSTPTFSNGCMFLRTVSDVRCYEAR